VYDTVKARLLAAYKSVPRGDPLAPGTLQGPLHTKAAVKEYTDGLEEIRKQGGNIIFGGNVVPGEGNYVEATIVEIDPSAAIVKTELFVPIMYIMKFKVWVALRDIVCMCAHVLSTVSSRRLKRQLR
jgi:aldehyde dehydrogenase family 7 member A1